MDLHIKTKFEVGQDVYHIESSRKVVECEKHVSYVSEQEVLYIKIINVIVLNVVDMVKL